MPTPEEEFVPTESEAERAVLPLSRIVVEIPYSRRAEISPRAHTHIAETSADLAAMVALQFRASQIEIDDGMHTQYAVLVESGKDQVAFCPPRVILAGTEKQANLALEANRLAHEIAEKTRDMVIAQKSAPLWNETPGHGWRGTREEIRAVGLKVQIVLAEAELNNITNLAEGEGALVLPRKQAAEVARRVDLVQARGETVTNAVFERIVSRVQKEFAPPVRRHAGETTSGSQSADKPRWPISFQPVFQSAFASARSINFGKLTTYAASAIVLPMVLIDCGGGRALIPTPGPEMIQKTGQGYDMALVHNVAIGTTLSAVDRQANPAMQQLLDSLAAYNTSQGIPLTDKAEIVTMKGTGSEAFLSQFAVAANPKSEIKAENTVPVTIAMIGPDGTATTAQGVYQVGVKDGITIASVSLLEKTDTGYKVGKVLYRTDLDVKGNITLYIADTKGTTPRYMKLTGTVDPNLGQKQALDSFLQAIGFLPTAKVFAAEATSQSPTATPKAETPTPQPPTPKPTDVPPTPEPTKQMKTYIVQKGDTVSEIAKRNGITVAELLAVNPTRQNWSLGVVDQPIKIPEKQSEELLEKQRQDAFVASEDLPGYEKINATKEGFVLYRNTRGEITLAKDLNTGELMGYAVSKTGIVVLTSADVLEKDGAMVPSYTTGNLDEAVHLWKQHQFTNGNPFGITSDTRIQIEYRLSKPDPHGRAIEAMMPYGQGDVMGYWVEWTPDGAFRIILYYNYYTKGPLSPTSVLAMAFRYTIPERMGKNKPQPRRYTLGDPENDVLESLLGGPPDNGPVWMDIPRSIQLKPKK